MEQFINPITLSFHLLQGYRNLLRETLQTYNLSESDIAAILKTINVDRGLYFSINRKYKPSSLSFAQFCQEASLFPSLATDCFPRLERLHIHQERAIRSVLAGLHTIVSTGTGSGKTESFLVPIIDHCLKNPGPGVKALIIYPMNALANDQLRRVADALSGTTLKFGTFIGSTPETASDELVEPIGPNHMIYRESMRANPPDILITNYVMLDWMLTRAKDLSIFQQSTHSLRFIILDELHSYRGNKATHLKYLLARLKFNLEESPIYIGTSATLRRNGASGEHEAAGKAQIDAFIKPLLDIADYTLVEPEYEPETEVDPTPIPDQAFEAQDSLDWSMSPDRGMGLHAVGLLTGGKYSTMDLADEDPKPHRDFRKNAFIVHLRKAMVEQGALSFSELVGLLSGLAPGQKEIHNPEQIVKAYLSGISFLNHLKSGRPILDYRLHLFVRNIGGHLKMCIKCHRYHSGAQEYCQECGFPLFMVYKNDIRKCIGKVSGHRLKWSLHAESDDRKNSYYALVEILESAQGENIGFDHEARVTSEELFLNYDPYGKLRLTLLSGVNSNNVLDETILLGDPKDDYEYLYQLVKSLLKALPSREKKILGFVDNREKASQYGLVLRHEFAADFFQAFLQLYYPSARKLNLEDAWKHLEAQVPQDDNTSSLEKSLFKELPFWYLLFVKSPVPDRRVDPLVLRCPEDFDTAEKDILAVFLQERALLLSLAPENAGRYIRFHTYHATQHKGIHTRPENRSELRREYPSISLGPDAVEYADVISKYDGATNDVMQDIIDRLVGREVLSEGQTADGKTHYYLNANQVAFDLPPSPFENYRALKESLLLTADVHSSEIRDTERKDIEARFQAGEVNFVMATPTLEMGIDIGDLESVVMVGAPPLPSNYAQRAGRAGRKRDSQFALLLTFCFESSNHDNYYFQNPKRMIDGEITPPSFNPNNSEVLAKHFNAFLLGGENLSSPLSQIVDPQNGRIGEKLAQASRVFGIESPVAHNLLARLSSQLAEHMAEFRRGNVQAALYAKGYFPDYAFRHDQVYAIPEGATADIRNAAGRTGPTIEDIAIASREPELAYYKFAPGETIFMAGDIYTITPVGEYTEYQVTPGQMARSYSLIEASRNDEIASRSRVRTKYELIQQFENADNYQLVQGILGIAYQPDCKIRFLNGGQKKQDQIKKFDNGDVDFAIGYELRRQALILRFDRAICSKESYYLSLVSALDREIKDMYGLDEGELKLLVDARPIDRAREGDKYVYVVFYDALGNGNVPLEQISMEFAKITESSYERLSTCGGNNGLGCSAGCYRCLMSYSLQPFAHLVEKPLALMFTGYLAGKNRFVPSVELPDTTTPHFDLTFSLSLSGDEVILDSTEQYTERVTDSQNAAIFNLMIRAIQAEFREGMEGLLIRAKQGYLVDAINRGEIKSNKGDFARLQFNLLRFKYVTAEKG